MIQRKTIAHLLLIALAAAAIGACFLQEPVLGDDLSYWSFAFDLHQRGLAIWQRFSFYDLRWPVWSVCWILQAILGPGMASYWGSALIYLAAGAAVSFSLGQRLTSSFHFAWACGIAFVFHPFLDAVSYCPMPDLSEAVWGSAAMLAWWSLMRSATARRSWLYAILLGLFVFILEANRVTGLFLVPVLAVCTICFFRQRFGWLIAAGLVALALYLLESSFYHHLFGDWLHDLHANAQNRAAKGTELANPWLLPVRFLDSFWQGPLTCAYSLFALAGIWFGWRKGGALDRALVIWFTLLLLEYSCAVQGLSPIRPLVRDGARFLSSLAAPMSALAVLGLWWLAALVRQLIPRGVVAAFWLTALAILTTSTSRRFFNPGFVPELRQYMAALPEGTRIFTHTTMYNFVILIDPSAAHRFRWLTANEILRRDSAVETLAEQADEFWYARHLAWLTSRQERQQKHGGASPILASYFAAPETNWQLARTFFKGGEPELALYQKRTPASTPASSLTSGEEAWHEILPALPRLWERGRDPERLRVTWPIPPALRGRLVRLEFQAASDQEEAFIARLRFHFGPEKQKEPIVFRPLLWPRGGLDFFTLQIPVASTACEIQLRFAKQTEWVEFTRVRAVIENDPPPN